MNKPELNAHVINGFDFGLAICNKNKFISNGTTEHKELFRWGEFMDFELQEAWRRTQTNPPKHKQEMIPLITVCEDSGHLIDQDEVDLENLKQFEKLDEIFKKYGVDWNGWNILFVKRWL